MIVRFSILSLLNGWQNCVSKDANLLVFKINMDADHGGASSRSKSLKTNIIQFIEVVNL